MNVLALFASLCCSTVVAAEPLSQLRSAPAPVSAPALQTFAAGHYFHLKGQATRATLSAEIGSRMPQLMKDLATAQAESLGPIYMVYRGMSQDPSKPFAFEIGVLVPKGTAAAGQSQVRVLPAFSCATVTYTGPIAGLGQAYQALYEAIAKGGRIPTDESRQVMLLGEAPASPNNMVLIQAGLR